ncbi:MAG: right-handed parallel beta-helix repeat-containing protein, partial [Promethearchaeota archaeon]
MKFKAKKKSLLFILGFIISLTITNSINFSTWQKSIVNNPKVSAGYNLSFIHIDGSISDNWTLTALQPWCNYDSDSGYYIIENVTIDASGSPASCGILINNSLDYNFIIRNCSVTYGTGGSGALSSVGGIKIVNSSRGILFNNTCSNGINWGSGILLYNEVHNITIERNEIYNNYNGIRVESSSYNITIKNNTINNNQYRGIWLINGVHNTTIINNNVNDNQFLSGIELRVNCDYNKIINNNGSLTNIYYASQDNGIYLIDGCDDNFIFNNSLNNNDNYGIQIELNCNNNTVLNNTASNLNGGTNQNRGIYLHSNSHYNNITGNIVNNNDQYGIYLSSCEHNSITGNIFYSTGDYGLGLEYCDYNNITGNTAKFNIEGGIYLSDSDWNNISKNFVNDNTQIGIFLRKSSWGSNNNTISNNTINRNDVGIVVYSSNDNN